MLLKKPEIKLFYNELYIIEKEMSKDISISVVRDEGLEPPRSPARS